MSLMSYLGKIDGILERKALYMIKKQFPAVEDIQLLKMKWFLYILASEHLTLSQLQRILDRLDNTDTSIEPSESASTNKHMTNIVEDLIRDLYADAQ